MQSCDLKNRTKSFALRVIKLCESLPKKNAGHVIAMQLLRSGTSVGANYRSACLGRSTKEFIAKIGVCLEESDESAFWMELIIDSNLMKKDLVEPLRREASELAAIFFTSIRSAKNKEK